MQQRIGIIRPGTVTSARLARHSRTSLDRALRHDAELWVAEVGDSALLLGAFQRNNGLARSGRGPVLKRASGGPELLLGPGTIHVALALSRPSAVTPCDEARIVNRYVRPLLRALTRTGYLAHYFGRDWVSVLHRPAAWVGFAHDTATGRTLFEAFVAVRAPFADSPRASFLGKAPLALESAFGPSVDPQRLADAIVDAYVGAYDLAAAVIEDDLTEPPENQGGGAVSGLPGDPPWTATVEESIGLLGAGPDAGGVFRVGGDLLVSRDALAHLEARVADAAPEDVGRITDETLGGQGVALDGIRSLIHVRDVILLARKSG